MEREDEVLRVIAITMDALAKAYVHTLASGKISELVKNRKDLKELNKILQDNLDELAEIIALKRLLDTNNISN